METSKRCVKLFSLIFILKDWPFRLIFCARLVDSLLPLERSWVVMISRIPDRQATKSRIPCPNFGESRFPGNSQIPNPVKIFFVFPNPAPYFGQIPDAENTLPDPGPRVIHALDLYHVNKSCKGPINPLSPEIKMHILLTVLHTFLMELVRRICLSIKTSDP